MNDISSLSNDELLRLVQALAAPSAGDYAADVAKSGGVGLAKGAIGLATLPRSMVDLAVQGGAYLADKVLPASVPREKIKEVAEGVSQAAGMLPFPGMSQRYSDAVSGVENLTGPLYKPKTTPGEYAQTVGELLPGAMMGGGGMLGNAPRYGVAPALTRLGQTRQGSPSAAMLANALMAGQGTPPNAPR